MSLEIVVGPMFSGKSTYALSYIRRQRVIGKKVLVIKPNIDNRYSREEVLVTHNQEQTHCVLWDIEVDLYPTEQMTCSDCIVFEEAQFFRGLSSFIEWFIQAHSKDILIVGLDGDAHQRKFGNILDCVPWATTITKLNALCCHCRDGTLAPYTKKKKYLGTDGQVDVGGPEKYESVCLRHLIGDIINV
jgi:thymidine kinase